MDMKCLGPKTCAEFMHMKGEGLNSNPYPKDSNEYRVFVIHIGRLQDRDFKRDVQEMESGV